MNNITTTQKLETDRDGDLSFTITTTDENGIFVHTVEGIGNVGEHIFNASGTHGFASSIQHAHELAIAYESYRRTA